MTFATGIRMAAATAALFLAAPFASAQTQAVQTTPPSGATFQCEDGGKMILSFAETGEGIAALVWLRGAVYQLPNIPPIPGPAQVVWSDGEHSLTWSPGVQLMWMSSDTHLMCGRSAHKH